MRAGVLCALVLVLPGVVPAQDFFVGGQQPRFRTISRGEGGLPNNAVSSIQQDADGFLWFGTQGGLARYDGRSMRAFSNQPFEPESIPHDLVQTIYFDPLEGVIWAGTYSGLARLDPETASFSTFQNEPAEDASLSNNVVIAVSRGPDGNLWVGTQDGLNRIDGNGTVTRIPTASEVIRDLHLDSTDTLWIGTYAGLERWDPEREETILEPIELPAPYVMAIDEIEPGTLLLGTWGLDPYPGGIVVWSREDGVQRIRQFANNDIYTVLSADDGSIWVGTWGGGLFALDAAGNEYRFLPGSDTDLGSPVIYSLYQDTGGLIWVGTNGGGLHVLSPRQRNFRAFFHDPDRPGSIPSGKVNALAVDGEGTLWAGLYSGGLARYDEERGMWDQFLHDRRDPNSLANDIVTTLYTADDGTLWIGSNGGLQRWNANAEHFETWGEDIFTAAPYSGDIVYAVTITRTGEYWIGTYRGGVTRYDPATESVTSYRHDAADPRSIGNDLIYDIIELQDGSVWIATNGGLSRYDRDRDSFTTFRYDSSNPRGLSSNTVRRLYQSTDGTLWIGTVSGGLNRFDPATETVEHFDMADGLSDNSVLGILEGNDGRLWLATQRGISILDPRSRLIDVLDVRDGLFGDEFQNGHVRLPDGSMLFGGAHGITRVNTSVQLRNPNPPRVHITDMRIFQRSVTSGLATLDGQSFTVGPDDRFLSIEFVGLDYESPRSNRYRYRLVGFDRDWVESGVLNVATYTNLPPGTYQFEATASNGDGVWAAEPAVISLTVERAWYLQWWAYLLYAAAVGGVLFAAVRAREAHVLAGQNALLEQANDQLELANTELARLSIHDPLTGLFNRRYFDQRGGEEWDRARRSAVPIAIIMGDVDHFKSFNDTYGHVAGDRALVAVSHAIGQVVDRSTDVVARYGGEELVILLYDTGLDGAMLVAERVRRAVRDAEPADGTRRITISLGVAARVPTADDPDDTITALVDTADRALYAAKRAGRDCVRRL